MFAPESDPLNPTALGAQPSLTAEDEKLKRPPNAFILFHRAVHAAVLTEHLDLPQLEVNRLIGRMWQTADEQSRNYYRDHARTCSDVFRTLHPDMDDMKHKKTTPKTASVKVPEPIRVKVVLLDRDIGGSAQSLQPVGLYE
jgi:hypothetical protein